MHLHPMMPLGIVHPIEMGRLSGVHGYQSMARRQRIIIERSYVIGRLRLMLHFAFASLGFSALIVGGGFIHFFV
jgi:hypothetical protein